MYLQKNILEVLNSLCYTVYFFLLLNKLQKGVSLKLKHNGNDLSLNRAMCAFEELQINEDLCQVTVKAVF